MALVAGPVGALAENRPMVLETVSRSNVSPPRPNSLLLKKSWTKEENNNEQKMVVNEVENKNKKRKKKRAAGAGVRKFDQLYIPTGESLGEGAQGTVSAYRNVITNLEFAVKTVEKTSGKSRHKVLKEIEIFHHCKGHDNILQLVEYFEEEERFHLVFEKMEGGTLLDTIERRGHLTEQEASLVIRDLAKAIDFLHKKGIAHRDLKPENILCVRAGELVPVKICDFDLGSGVIMDSRETTPVTTPELQTPVGSAEYMAPEVVDVWQDQAWSYDKKCDIWSLGIILYMLLCGYPPFCGQCGDDCGWERSEGCQSCQDMLFTSIQDGEYGFPNEEWDQISEDAKDLISRMLVREPQLRYSSAQVLRHPWVYMEAPGAQLATPRLLLRNNSVKELDAFAENANAMNRMVLNHLSISEAFNNRPSFTVGDRPWEDEFADISENNNGDTPIVFSSGIHRSLSSSRREQEDPLFNDPMFSLADSYGSNQTDEGQSNSSGEDEDCPDEAPILWMGLTPPGTSGLARRRLQKLSSGDSMDGDKENMSPLLGP